MINKESNLKDKDFKENEDTWMHGMLIVVDGQIRTLRRIRSVCVLSLSLI